MEKNDRKKTKNGKKSCCRFEKEVSHRRPKNAEYIDYLLELHKLQGIILNQLDKDL
jgi:hypothetical protein